MGRKHQFGQFVCIFTSVEKQKKKKKQSTHLQIIHIDANNTICNLHTYITSNNIHKQFITNKKFYWQLNNKSMPVLLSNKVHTQPYVFKKRAQI